MSDVEDAQHHQVSRHSLHTSIVQIGEVEDRLINLHSLSEVRRKDELQTLAAIANAIQADLQEVEDEQNTLHDELERHRKIIVGLKKRIKALEKQNQDQGARINTLEKQNQDQAARNAILEEQKERGEVVDFIGDVFQKFFCKVAVIKAQKKLNVGRLFHDGADVVNSLEYIDDGDEVKQRKTVTARRIMEQELKMNLDTVMKLDDMRLRRNGVRHVVDYKRQKDPAYMAETITKLQKEVREWGKKSGEAVFAESVVEWSAQLLSYCAAQ
jgi:chromosome segregation ATPase